MRVPVFAYRYSPTLGRKDFIPMPPPVNSAPSASAQMSVPATPVPTTSAPVVAVQPPQISEAQRTKTEIHTLLNQYPELGMDRGYVEALGELPSGIIVRARKADPITAKAMLNKALVWKDKLLAAYPDLAQRPAQFAMALETPEAYLMDRSMGKQAGKDYNNRSGGVR